MTTEFGSLTGLRSLVDTIPVDRLRFLTSDRRRAYAAILWALLRHRRAHEIEVYYDDLMIEALAIVPAVEPGPYTPDAFRGDVKQLEDWGSLAPRRLEPRRIETLADRSLQKFLCRLDDDTVAILEFLEGRSRATAAALSDRGRHLLRDAAERLAEALRLALKIARTLVRASETAEVPDVARSDDLLRLSHLCLEVDRKIDDAARELAAFDAALVEFAVSPFRMEALAEVVDRLERYVEDYVAEASERARSLHRNARKFLRPALADVLARSHECAERRVREDPFFGGAPGTVPDLRQILAGLTTFFAPGGRFEALLERVHASARDVVRRVHRHVENVRARNIRIETLRDRSREVAGLGDDDIPAAVAWVNGLFASAHVVTDLRCGTPEEKSALPRPARRYEARRAAHRSEVLAEKRGVPGQSRALERLRLLQLDRFVEDKILQGQPRARLAGSALAGVDDFRRLLEAIKLHELRAGRTRKLLSYRVVRGGNGAARGRARFALAEGRLDAPDLVFTRSAPGGKT